MTYCAGPECVNEAKRVGLCDAHYQQQYRGHRLKPLRTSTGSSEQVVFRCPPELKHAAEKAAAHAGVEPAEWWRRAGRAALG